MYKNYKSIAMMLFLGTLSVGTANATPAEMKVDGTNVVQQAGTCTGVVKDGNGEAIIGASVAIKGTTRGSITDIDGNFSIPNVNAGDILTISYIGYATQEVTWKGQPLNIVLKEDTEVLDEVVVLAYGVKQKRGKLTNSVSSVSEETLTKGSYGGPAQALIGAVSGLKVQQTSGFAGATPSITLRGGTSYDGSGEPLVVVDGQVRTDGLSDLNSNDIESMEVMKDAGATAIYGARAANGVILITTKQGKAGKAQVNFNMKVGAQYCTPTYEMMDTEGYIYWMRRAHAETPWAPSANLNATTRPMSTGATELSSTSQYNILGYTGSDY